MAPVHASESLLPTNVCTSPSGHHRSECRVVLRLLHPNVVKVSVAVETIVLVYMMLYAWVVLYLDLFGVCVCRTEPLGRPGPKGEWQCTLARVAWFTGVSFSFVMLCDSVAFYLLGAIVYGSLYARRRTFVAAVLYNAIIVFAMIAYVWRYTAPMYAIPFACSHRLLLNSAYQYKRRAWVERTQRLAQKQIDFSSVCAAIQGTPELSPVERRALKLVVKEVAGEDCKWGCEEFYRFQQLAAAALERASVPSWGMPESHRIDHLVMSILGTLADQGSAVAAQAKTTNYNLMNTVVSCSRHLCYGDWCQLLLFCLLSLLDACLVAIVQTWLISKVVKSAEVGDRASAKIQLLAYMGSYLLDALTYVLQSYTSSICLAASIAKLQTRVAEGMLSMGPQQHASHPSGSVITTFSSDIARVDALWQSFIWALLSPLMRVVVAVLYAIQLKPQVGVLAVTIFPFIFSTIPQTRSTAAAALQAKTNAASISMFQNGAACQRMIWTTDHQSQWLRSYLRPLIAEQEGANFSSKHMAGLVQAYAAQLITIFVGLHISIFAWLAVEGAMTVPELTAMMSLFLTLSSPVRMLAGFFRTAVTQAGSAQRVDDFIRATESVVQSRIVHDVDLEGVAGSFVRNISDGSGLKLHNIIFRYPNSTQDVLSAVSLRVYNGEFAALVGESGCGKSTLLSLMMTWLQPSDGFLALDQIEVKAGKTNMTSLAATPERRLRDEIAVVFQDTMLLNSSVHENIAFGAPEPSRDDVRWAAQAAGIADFIDSLPNGFDTMLGGIGDASLSGGQAQRVCIARALCRKPRLLLLDEATSALDPETENGILETISNLRNTHPREFGSLIVVSITHHPDTLKYADVVIQMAAGALQSIERTKKHDG